VAPTPQATTINHDLNHDDIRSGRINETTVRYWAEWLDSRDATPPDLEFFLDFIQMMESDVSEALPQLIPLDWYPND